MYANAKYVNHPYDKDRCLGVSVDINGLPSFVPLDEANSDYAAIMALVAEGKLTIAPANAEGAN